MRKHLKRAHPKILDEFENKERAGRGKSKYSKFKAQTKFTVPSKQKKMTDFNNISRVLQTCAKMAVEDGISFSSFDKKNMKEMTSWSKLGAKDSSRKVINAENVKDTVRKLAAHEREELKRNIRGKLINLSADLATCESRSFLGM